MMVHLEYITTLFSVIRLSRTHIASICSQDSLVTPIFSPLGEHGTTGGHFSTEVFLNILSFLTFLHWKTKTSTTFDRQA